MKKKFNPEEKLRLLEDSLKNTADLTERALLEEKIRHAQDEVGFYAREPQIIREALQQNVEEQRRREEGQQPRAEAPPAAQIANRSGNNNKPDNNNQRQ